MGSASAGEGLSKQEQSPPPPTTTGLSLSTQQKQVCWLVHAQNPSTPEVLAFGSEVQSPRLRNEFEVSWATGTLPQTNKNKNE